MSIFKEIPPTAGFALPAKDLFSALIKAGQKEPLETLFKDYLGSNYARIINSGTAAFYIILKSLKELSDKKTVIIPSFVCPLLVLAINRAGLKVKVCDINKDNFDYDAVQLEGLCSSDTDILAICAVHLAGIPLQYDSIRRASEIRGIYVIEDCAQALGAEYKTKKAGTLGDFSFFSLCRGKGLTIYEGGVISTTKTEYFRILDEKIAELAKQDLFGESLKILELFGYWAFYRPGLFWFVYGMPKLYWKWKNQPLRAAAEYFDPDFPIHRVSGFRKSVGAREFIRLEKEIEKQREKAGFYIERLKELKNIKIISEPPGTKSTYPYLTLLFNSGEDSQRMESLLNNLGLGVSKIYACAISDYTYLKGLNPEGNCQNARSLSSRHLSLSTSAFLKEKDMQLVVEKLRKCL